MPDMFGNWEDPYGESSDRELERNEKELEVNDTQAEIQQYRDAITREKAYRESRALQMTMTEYSNGCAQTANYNSKPLVQKLNHALAGTGITGGLLYCLGKLAGECGELQEKIWKYIRDSDGAPLSQEQLKGILKEYGDMLWYITRGAHELGSSLGMVAVLNQEKLFSRKERGVLGGSGDDR